MRVQIRHGERENLHKAATDSVSLGIPCISLLDSNEKTQTVTRQQVVDLYARLRPSLQAYLGMHGLNEDQMEDVIQEAFLRLVRHTEKGKPSENLRAWVFRVVHNLSMDFRRSEKRLRASGTDRILALGNFVDPAPNPEQWLLLHERRQRLSKAFAQLTPKQRHCLLLRAEGLRYREIAVVMGVSVQRVGELIQRAASHTGR